MVVLLDGKVLLQRRSKDEAVYANMWDLPWQEVADGASPEDAFLAMARTELGIEVTSFALLSAGDDVVEGACWRRFVYRVNACDGDLEGKDASRRWYSEKEIADVFQLNPLVATVPVFEG